VRLLPSILLIVSAEGRELFIVNIDYKASESDVRKLLSEVNARETSLILQARGITES
jgi:hypothetical protein